MRGWVPAWQSYGEVVRFPGVLHRYWEVREVAPGQFRGVLTGAPIPGRFDQTFTEVGSESVVFKTLERSNLFLGLPVISATYSYGGRAAA